MTKTIKHYEIPEILNFVESNSDKPLHEYSCELIDFIFNWGVRNGTPIRNILAYQALDYTWEMAITYQYKI